MTNCLSKSVQKKAENTDSDINKVTRCQHNMYRLHNNKIKGNVIIKQMEYSKLIFNKGLFCQRTWYSRVYNKICDFFIDNLNDYLYDFSPIDKYTLFTILIFRKDVSNINLLLSYVKLSEKSIIEKLIDKANSVIINADFIEPIFVDSEKTEYAYDLSTPLNLINKIKIKNFNDEYGNLTEFMTILKSAFVHKINNQKNPKRKQKRKKVCKQTKKIKSTKKIICFHLVISTLML